MVMMRSGRAGEGSKGMVQTASARLRVLVALAVMLLAVLPHATLAASMVHSMAVPAAMPGHDHGGSPASDPSPCHDASERIPAAAHTMPPCCILGCGMLASAPQPQTALRLPRWRLLPPDAGVAGPGTTVEPAERPPRLAARLATNPSEHS